MSKPVFDDGRAQRAKQYIRKGLVVDLEETDEEVWQASVEGNDVYDVKLTVDGEDIVDAVCSCPDDLSQYCKHIIAVYLVITKPDHVTAVESSSKPKQAKRPKSKSLKPRVDDYIAGLSADGLVELLGALRRDIKNVDSYIANNILPPSGNVADDVRRQLKSSLASARRSGYFDYHASQTWLDALDNAFAQADRLVAINVLEALRACGVIYEVAVSHAGTIDDSNGEFGEAMEPAIERYYEIARTVTEPELLSNVLNQLLDHAKKFAGDGWYSSWSWLKNVAALAQDREDVAAVNRVLDECLAAEEQTFTSNFGSSLDAEIRYGLMAKFGTEAELEAFVGQYFHEYSVRELYADHHIELKKYQAARQLCEQSIELDKALRGVVIGWVQRLQVIANETSDSALYKRTARTLFESKGDLEQLALLKRLCSRQEWVDEYNRLITNQIESGSRSLLRELYIFENKMDSLVDSLSGCSIDEVSSYHEYLKKSFQAELASLYLAGVRAKLQNATDRGTYQQCARALRRAKKLGAGDKVGSIIKEMITQYPNRRAMVEELREV